MARSLRTARDVTPVQPSELGRLRGQRILVTGAAGFVGHHVVSQLAATGAVVTTTARNLDQHRGPQHTGDLADLDFARSLVTSAKPQIVIHLAAATRPGDESDGFDGFGDSARSTWSLTRALVSLAPAAHLILLSSSAVYGRPRVNPITEAAELRPITPYGVSKATQELVARQAHWGDNLPVTIVRAFNLVGPGLPPNLLLGSVAEQLAMPSNNQRRFVDVGNLATRRDYLDVRDLARSLLHIAATDGIPPVVNVASERSRSGTEVVARLLELSEIPAELRESISIQQSTNVLEQIGSTQLLREHTGWRPLIDFDQSLQDMMLAATKQQEQRTL